MNILTILGLINILIIISVLGALKTLALIAEPDEPRYKTPKHLRRANLYLALITLGTVLNMLVIFWMTP